MSASKRRRVVDDDDSEVHIESASSSLRQHTPKRPRIALAAENGGSTVSDDEDEEDDLQPAPAFQDEDFDDAEHEFYIRELSKHRENVEMENGIIEEVHCTNFMCHAKFSITLGPLINFVIGHNGSGKSAVLTALTICLGNKASSTNRGASLKSLIKEGTESATVRVKIKNRGVDAYRPELYGRSVIVERHFSRSGSGQFRMKNSEGKVVSTKKRDLDDMIDYWGLQLDNPINVLNQDMARQFLSNSSPHDKYKFFIRGTQLEVLDKDYGILAEEVDKLQARLESSADDIKEQRSKFLEAEARKKRLEASSSYRTEINRVRRMHAWAQVEEQEQIAEERRREVERAETSITEAEHSAETSAGIYEAAQQALERSAQNVAALEEALEPAQVKRRAEQERFEEGRAKLLELNVSKRDAKEKYNNEQAKRKKLEDDISAERALLDDANGHEHTARLERLDALRRDLEQAQEDSRTHQEAQHGLEEARIAANDEVDRAKEPISDAREKVDRAQQVLSKMQSEQNKRFAGYKPGIERLLSMIDRETRWSAKPIGPLGVHCKVLKPEWAGLIDKMFGAALEQFVVTSREDQQLLVSIMKRANYNTSILIGNARPLDTTGKEPADDRLTVLRALDIENDLVRNQLIISHSIEQVVLIRDRNEGQEFMNRRMPNVKAVLTFRTGDMRGQGVRFDLSRSGAQRSSPLQVWQGASRMQTDRNDQIERQQGQIASARQELDVLQRVVQQKQAVQKSAGEALERWRRAKNSRILAGQRISDEIEALKDEIDRNRPQDGRLQELEHQLKNAQENEAAQKHITQDLVREKAIIDEDQREIKARLDEIGAEIATHSERLESAKSEQHDLTERRLAALKQKNEDFAAIDDNKRLLEEKKDRLEKQLKVVEEEFVVKAQEISPRVPVDPGMTVTKLDNRMDTLRKDILNAEKEAGGSIEKLVEEYRAARETYENAKNTHDQLKSLRDALGKALNSRKDRWIKMRRFITSRARSYFTYLLGERSFRGRVIMDHIEKQLDIAVQPNAADRDEGGRAAPTLSGGEKSFSTVCLLLSIWEAMGSPIRCLDEFDVFMDNVNRDLSLNLIINAARRSVGKQYIFITPQSMKSDLHGTDVAIHKIADPERGQTALPFTQA